MYWDELRLLKYVCILELSEGNQAQELTGHTQSIFIKITEDVNTQHSNVMDPTPICHLTLSVWTSD